MRCQLFSSITILVKIATIHILINIINISALQHTIKLQNVQQCVHHEMKDIRKNI